jgi:O-antigen ligase
LFGNRAQSTFGNPNFAGNYFAMVSVAALGLVLLYHRNWKKGLALAGFGLNLFGMLASFTRGAWIAFGLALLVLILAAWGLLRKNLSWLGTAVLVLVIAAGLLFLTPFGARLIPRVATLQQAETFFKDRGVFWEAGWLTALRYPVSGAGLETLRLSHRPYKTADYLPMEEERKFQYSGLDRAHNEFLDVAAMRVFVGLAAYLWFLVA